MKTRYQALLLAAILSASVLLSFFFLKPSYHPIVDFDGSTTYISGKLVFYCYNVTNGIHFLGNFSVSLFRKGDDGELALVEVINITKGYGQTVTNYVLGKLTSSILRLIGQNDELIPFPFIVRYLNITSFESPHIWQRNEEYVGEIWLGV